VVFQSKKWFCESVSRIVDLSFSITISHELFP
jgi:hypothetical protein